MSIISYVRTLALCLLLAVWQHGTVRAQAPAASGHASAMLPSGLAVAITHDGSGDSLKLSGGSSSAGQSVLRLPQDDKIAANQPTASLRVIGELVHAFVIIDSHPARSGGLSYCQAGNEDLLRVVSTAAAALTQTFALKVASCWDNIELSTPDIEWRPNQSELIIHWFHPPNGSRQPEDRRLRLSPDGVVLSDITTSTSLLIADHISIPNGFGDGTIKIGILHSLAGTMAISETTLKDEMLMLIEAQNKKGGLLGKKLEPVVVDPASNWPLFAEKARQLLTVDKVAAVFGGWTSVSRKSVLPVFEKNGGILFYPAQTEGQESSRNIFYTGATPNQQAIPAVAYLMDHENVKRWVLAGTDYVYSRTTNHILEAYLTAKGVHPADILINYTPFGNSDWENMVASVKKFGSAGRKAAVISTIVGDANMPFYKEFQNQHIRPTDIPVMSLLIGEEELTGFDPKLLSGQLAARNYFQSIDTLENRAFINQWHNFIKDPRRPTTQEMEAHYLGFNMWVKAVQKVGTTDPGQVIDAMIGISVPNLTGGEATVASDHYITKPALIGEIEPTGQFKLVFRTNELTANAWSPYVPDTRDLIGDWRAPLKCGAFNVVTGTCTPGKGM
jgi:urea transport system substrate-binding protein